MLLWSGSSLIPTSFLELFVMASFTLSTFNHLPSLLFQECKINFSINWSKSQLAGKQPCCLKREGPPHMIYYSLSACSFSSSSSVWRAEVTVGPFLYGGACLPVPGNYCIVFFWKIFSSRFFFVFLSNPNLLDIGFLDLIFLPFIFWCLTWFSLLFWLCFWGDFLYFLFSFFIDL